MLADSAEFNFRIPMPNFFLTDKNGTKHSLTEQQLQALASQGKITPNTPLETDTGHKGLAGQIPGLQFNSAVPTPFAQPAQATPPPANVFCTNCGSPVSEQVVACMSCGMKPTGQKKFCRHCGVGINPEQVICVKCGASLTGGPIAGKSVAKSVPLNANDTTKKLNLYFMVYWIGMAAAIPTCGLAALPAVVFMYMLLYQLWKLIPADIARTSPGKAVGFCFIPLFNIFYWFFVAFGGLGKDMNETLERRNIPSRVNDGLGNQCCFLFVLQFILSILANFIQVLAVGLENDGLLIVAGIVMIVSYIISIAVVIMLIFFFKSVKNGAIELLERGGA